MPARSRAFILAAGLPLLLVLLLAVWLLWRMPPTLARLLPEADAIVYADLRPARLLVHWEAHPVVHSEEYQQFIDRTGILPERDLQQAAFALHRMADPGGPNGVVGYSEVVSGHFDPARLTGYLRGAAASEESYAGHHVFSIPIAIAPGESPAVLRTLRIALVDDGTVAASNMPTAEQIHAMLDRARTSRLLRGGPSLLTQTYTELPAGATAWGVGQLALPFSESGHVAALGLSLPIPAQQPMLASLRYTTALHLRLELLAGSNDAAVTQADALRGLLDVLRALSLGHTAVPAPPAMAEFLRSVIVAPEHDRTLLRAVIPLDLVRSIAGSGQSRATTALVPAEQRPAVGAKTPALQTTMGGAHPKH